METERPRRRRMELQHKLKKEQILSENDEDSHQSHNDNTFLTPDGTENSNGFSHSGDDGGDVFVPGQEDDDVVMDFRRGRSNLHLYWTQAVEQVFIERIKSYPPLYDHSSENWKNTTVKDVIWEEISQEIGIPACECKRHFKHMRDKFVRHKRTGRGSKTWKAGEAMNFLVEMDLIKHRPTKSLNDQEIIGNSSHDTSKSDEMESPSPRTQVIESANGVIVTLTQPLPTRSLRSALKRKKDEQNVNTALIDKRVKTERTLEVPTSTLVKAAMRKVSNDIRIQSFTNGQSLESQTQVPVMPTPQLVLSTVPQQLTTHKSESTEPSKTYTNQGPNYFFGQYIASVLDALPQGESLMTRHKLQEILFEAQRKSVNPNPPQIIQFQCTNCTSLFSPI